MAQYVAFDKNVEVYGKAVESWIGGMGNLSRPIIEKYGIYPIDTDKWYPIQDLLDAYKELDEGRLLEMVAVGMAIPEHALWPPEINTVTEALASLNNAYRMNHRNGDFGSYDFESTDPNSGVMVCRNPYPSDLDFGIIYGIVKKFRPANRVRNQIIVKRDESKPTRLKGADSCTFLIEW